jgi:hypothetical protein
MRDYSGRTDVQQRGPLTPSDGLRGDVMVKIVMSWIRLAECLVVVSMLDLRSSLTSARILEYCAPAGGPLHVFKLSDPLYFHSLNVTLVQVCNLFSDETSYCYVPCPLPLTGGLDRSSGKHIPGAWVS